MRRIQIGVIVIWPVIYPEDCLDKKLTRWCLNLTSRRKEEKNGWENYKMVHKNNHNLQVL